MRKFVCFLLSLSLALCCFAAAAADKKQDDFSLQGKTDEELLAMYQEIQAILLSRSGEYSLTLPAGKYEVGLDIPAGEYRMECSGAYSSSQVSVYQSEDSKWASDRYLMSEMTKSSIVGKITLEDGNILSISGSAITVTGYNAAQMSVEGGGKIVDQPADGGGFVVSAGKYQVGTEIPAGTYRVVCEDEYGMAAFRVYDSEKSVFPSYDTVLAKLFGNGEIGKIELKEGSYVEIAEGSVTFYLYTGVGK